MTINYKVWDFPSLPIQKQLFHVPGAAYDGGYTSGGARIMSPEPGGRSVLEIQIAYQVKEWDTPFSSWLMSKINGDIFRIKLTKTPQLIKKEIFNLVNLSGIPWAYENLYNQPKWDNGRLWSNEVALFSVSMASEGSTKLNISLIGLGEILKYGHVIGHKDSSYIINEIEYNGNIATLNISPPLRSTVLSGDLILTEPYFTGSISNGNEIKTTYDSNNVGNIQLNRIVFQEAIL